MIHRLAAAILILLAAAPHTHADQAEDRWYVIEIQGQRSGWMHEFTTTENQNIRTGMVMHLEFGRGQMKAQAGIETSFLETPDGAPIEMAMTQRLGAVPATTTFTFDDNQITMTSENAGQAFTQTMPLPDGHWLTPAAAARHIENQLAAGAEEISVRSLTPLSGPAPIDTTMRVLARENIQVLGRTVPALKTSVVTSILPGQQAEQHTDLQGRVLRSEQAFGAMTMVVIAADKQLALSKLDPPELMASTFVKPVGAPITHPRRATSATYLLTTSTNTPVPAFTGAAQNAQKLDNGALRVTVNLNRADPTPPSPEHLASTSMLAASDPLVAQLTKRALEFADNTPRDRALALRAFVYEFINKKSLGVGYASASEVARTREGDCTEHAVLLAALLRAEHIPSRVVSGLVYTQEFAGARDVFGYHAWTQAYIDGAWTDLDATLPHTTFDAAHIALGASAMNDGELVNALADIAPVLGTLTINVESIK